MLVHVKDMCGLDNNPPDIAREFRNGKCNTCQIKKIFFCIAIDHGYEQNNGVLKKERVIIGLTDAGVLLHLGIVWTRACVYHLRMRVISKSTATQKLFSKQINALVETIYRVWEIHFI